MSATSTDTDADLHAFRDQVPVAASRAYLFSGGIAPASLPVLKAIDSWLEIWATDPIRHRSHYRHDLERTRSALATLIGADADGIAITSGTSRASNLATSLIDASAGANVVVDSTTYPSSIMPWLLASRAGVQVRHVSNPPDDDWPAWLEAVDRRTSAIVVSHVDPDTGYRHDLGRLATLAHEQGALLVVDGAQSVGAVQVDVKAMGIDLLAGVSMKWLMGPVGLGFLYARPDLLERAPMLEASYTSATRSPADSLVYAPGGRRLEHGVQNLLGLAGFHAAIEMVDRVGIGAIERRISSLVGACIEGLRARGWSVVTPINPERRAGVIVVEAGDPAGLSAWLRRAGVDVWGYPERHRIRIDPHGFNDAADINRLLASIDLYRDAPPGSSAGTVSHGS
jgi:cysteine desulfurase / selenocysteine lyase